MVVIVSNAAVPRVDESRYSQVQPRAAQPSQRHFRNLLCSLRRGRILTVIHRVFEFGMERREEKGDGKSDCCPRAVWDRVQAWQPV